MHYTNECVSQLKKMKETIEKIEDDLLKESSYKKHLKIDEIMDEMDEYCMIVDRKINNLKKEKTNLNYLFEIRSATQEVLNRLDGCSEKINNLFLKAIKINPKEIINIIHEKDKEEFFNKKSIKELSSAYLYATIKIKEEKNEEKIKIMGSNNVSELIHIIAKYFKDKKTEKINKTEMSQNDINFIEKSINKYIEISK